MYERLGKTANAAPAQMQAKTLTAFYCSGFKSSKTALALIQELYGSLALVNKSL
jgi:hypothetical protein